MMPSGREQKDGFLLNIWQAITLVGDARERSDEIEPSELETVLAETESLLIDAVSEAVQHPAKPFRRWRWLRFWRAAADTPSRELSWSGSTAVIPFPGLRIPESTVLRAGTSHGVNRLLNCLARVRGVREQNSGCFNPATAGSAG
jgi:hypothetical protein